MGEKVETKNEGDKKAAEGGEKNAVEGGENKAAEPITVVLKLDLHCEGCAKKIRRSIRHLEGVEKVKADCSANKLTVTGNVDPTWLRERVETKTKKKVDLVSPQPKKDGGDKKPEEKPEKKAEEKKPEEKKDKPKEPAVSTVVMKIKLHCDGCAHKIKRTVLKNIDGVKSVATDLQKDLLTVIGTMEVKELVSFLKEKLKRGIDIIPPQKKDNGSEDKKAKEGSGDKKEKEGGDKKESGGGDKKEKEEGGGEKAKAGSGGGEANKGKEEAKVEVNKMEYHGPGVQTFYSAPMMYHDQNSMNQDYGLPMYHHHQDYPSTSTGYVVHYAQGPPTPPPTYINNNININDQMFSDENPNGCFIM